MQGLSPAAAALAFVDTHLHLDAAEFDSDRDAVIARAQAAGVTRFLLPAVEVNNFDTVKSLAESLPGSAYALGIHPLYTAQAQPQDIATLKQTLLNSTALAVGEIGLDGFVPGLDMARQVWFFCEQLKLARDFNLPVVLHIRRAQDLVLKYLRRFRPPGGIAHAFNGSPQQAEAFIGLGFKLGFGGTMSYSGSLRIRQLARTLPLESIVLETDAPDIPPSWLVSAQQTMRNEPAELIGCARVLAELRQLSLQDLATHTTRNAFQALRWPH